MVERGHMEAVVLIPQSQGQEETKKSWGQGVYFLGPGAAFQLEWFEGTGGRGGWHSSGSGNTVRGDLESPPELRCAGWWKRRRLEPARECGGKQ